MHYFSNLFDKVLYMFRICSLSIIRSITARHFTAWVFQASLRLQKFRPYTIPSRTWFAQVCTVMCSTFFSSGTIEGTLTYVIVAFPHVATWLEILSNFSWNFDKWQLACHFCLSVCLCVRLSVFLCVRLSVCLSVRPSVCLPVRPSVLPDGLSWNFIFQYVPRTFRNSVEKFNFD
jgi:hypothetical protein